MINEPVATALDFPDIAALSNALTTALAEVQRLGDEVEEVRASQRRARRAFDEFSASVRESLDSAVTAITAAMSATVDQTLGNAELLQRLRARLNEAAGVHDARIQSLEEQFKALSSLALKQGESLDEGVARVNSEEKALELATLQKRSTLLAERDIDVAPRAHTKSAAVADLYGLGVKKSHVAHAAVPLVRAP